MKDRMKLLQKHKLCTKRKAHIKKKGKIHTMIFSDKRKVNIVDFWE